jgi:hypothetical protein
MSTTPSDATQAVTPPPFPERRRNAALRALIDEMLFTVRGLQQREGGNWTPEDRARAESELDRIMARVRNAAVPGTPGTGE